jgi:hypothetical protein
VSSAISLPSKSLLKLSLASLSASIKDKLMNDKLQEIKTDLAVNGKQTKEKRLVMKEFSTEITYDEENLLSMSKENLRVVLEIIKHQLFS